jgi:hypothetical protein
VSVDYQEVILVILAILVILVQRDLMEPRVIKGRLVIRDLMEDLRVIQAPLALELLEQQVQLV